MLAVLTVQNDIDDTLGNLAGDNELSLREAIQIANNPGTTIDGFTSNDGLDTITFSSLFNNVQTIQLTDQLPTINNDVKISGPGSDLLTLDAGGGPDNSIGNGNGFRIFDIDDGDDDSQSSVSLSRLTLTGGDSDDSGGGAIRNRENLILINCTVNENFSADEGGGIFNDEGNLTITGSTISGNSSPYGGGIYSNTNLTDQTTRIVNSTISGNAAGFRGGGLYNIDGLTVIESSTISDNAAPAGAGSGVASYGDTYTRTEVLRSIISSNSNEDVAIVGDTTNSFQSNGFNLIGSGNDFGSGQNALDNFSSTGDIVDTTNSLLAPLADNGGTTKTHALLLGSPAIDAGGTTTLTHDQRGEPFSRVVDDPVASGSGVDIGAYERQTLASLNLIVDNIDDENDGDYSQGNLSLREAIGLANGSIGSNTISFSALFNKVQSVQLLDQLPTITSELTIVGPGAGLLTLDAGGGVDFVIGNGDGFRLFNIEDSDSNHHINVLLSGLTLIGGDPSGDGGAIRNSESLTVVGSRISGNASADEGGGIYNDEGNLAITGSTISKNSAENGGGGIYSINGELTVMGSTISENSAGSDGGGIYSDTELTVAATQIINSTLSGNTADERGGGLFNQDGLTVIEFSTITNNRAGTGVGGGVASYGDTYTRTEVVNSIISGNSNEDVAIVSDTINSFQSNGFNLIGSGNDFASGKNALDNFSSTGDIVDTTNPLLAPLADNGGPTQTHALLGSPAIDAGKPSFLSPPNYDQRGFDFDRIVGGRIDIGAFESGASSADFDTDGDVDGADFLAWQRGIGSSSVVHSDGDANVDGVVDAVDLAAWQVSFGRTQPQSLVTKSTSEQEEALESRSSAVGNAELRDAAIVLDSLHTEQERQPRFALKQTAAPEPAAFAAAFAVGSATDEWVTEARSVAARDTLAAGSAETTAANDPWIDDALLEAVFE